MIRPLTSSVLLLALSTATMSAHAQSCHGTPPRGGLSVDVGKIGFGSSIGASGAMAGSHVAFGASYRSTDRGTGVSGMAADGRFAVVIGSKRLQVCPGFGLGYEKIDWKVTSGTVATNNLSGWGGVSAGYEQPVYKELNLIPFFGMRYAFRAIKYDFSDTQVENTTTTADTVSGAEAEYGMLARYRFVYAGFVGNAPLKSAPAYLTRWVIGVTFPARKEGTR